MAEELVNANVGGRECFLVIKNGKIVSVVCGIGSVGASQFTSFPACAAWILRAQRTFFACLYTNPLRVAIFIHPSDTRAQHYWRGQAWLHDK